MAFPIYPHAKMSFEDVENARGAAAKQPSIWKRELSVGRKKTESEPVEVVGTEPEEVESASEKKPSIWKRDLSLGGKKKKKKKKKSEPALEVGPEPQDEQVEQTQDERTSIWKRDLSF